MWWSKPLFETSICGQPLRFFEAPSGGGAEFPWHVHTDLMTALKMNEQEQLDEIASLMSLVPDDCKLRIVEGGLVFLASSRCATGLFIGRKDKHITWAFAQGQGAAIKTIIRSMSPDEQRRWCDDASQREHEKAQ